jgi:hypothetical protein
MNDVSNSMLVKGKHMVSPERMMKWLFMMGGDG